MVYIKVRRSVLFLLVILSIILSPNPASSCTCLFIEILLLPLPLFPLQKNRAFNLRPHSVSPLTTTSIRSAMANPALTHSAIDISQTPEAWGPTADGEAAPKFMAARRVDVIFSNINAASDFTVIRDGTDEPVHHALMQVTKHVARGLYRIVSLQLSEHSCVVVLSTDKSYAELESKGFPWDRADDPQPEVVLK